MLFLSLTHSCAVQPSVQSLAGDEVHALLELCSEISEHWKRTTQRMTRKEKNQKKSKKREKKKKESEKGEWTTELCSVIKADHAAVHWNNFLAAVFSSSFFSVVLFLLFSSEWKREKKRREKEPTNKEMANRIGNDLSTLFLSLSLPLSLLFGWVIRSFTSCFTSMKATAFWSPSLHRYKMALMVNTVLTGRPFSAVLRVYCMFRWMASFVAAVNIDNLSN